MSVISGNDPDKKNYLTRKDSVAPVKRFKHTKVLDEVNDSDFQGDQTKLPSILPSIGNITS